MEVDAGPLEVYHEIRFNQGRQGRGVFTPHVMQRCSFQKGSLKNLMRCVELRWCPKEFEGLPGFLPNNPQSLKVKPFNELEIDHVT